MLTIPEVKAAGGYRVIYADPAWRYDDRGCEGAAEKHYTPDESGRSTMAKNDLQALPIAEIAARDCALFLWVVSPLLDEAIDLIRAWGFKLKTKAFEWVKYSANSHRPFYGTGRYTRAGTESCLLATRGRPRPVNKNQSELIETVEGWDHTAVYQGAVAEHSRKPDEVRERIRVMMGDVASIELFARTRWPGWDAWGNDPAIGCPDVLLTSSDLIKVTR